VEHVAPGPNRLLSGKTSWAMARASRRTSRQAAKEEEQEEEEEEEEEEVEAIAVVES